MKPLPTGALIDVRVDQNNCSRHKKNLLPQADSHGLPTLQIHTQGRSFHCQDISGHLLGILQVLCSHEKCMIQVAILLLPPEGIPVLGKQLQHLVVQTNHHKLGPTDQTLQKIKY